jgi:hypothetical protein
MTDHDPESYTAGWDEGRTEGARREREKILKIAAKVLSPADLAKIIQEIPPDKTY